MVQHCPREDRRELAIALLLAEQPVPPDEEAAWLIYLDDKEMTFEIFSGPGAEGGARGRFERLRTAWSITLFRSVARG